ncbi:hypothetical protein E3N88_13503 [Mikania micrantha]|uniref:Integrase catalytic domain-containing protein n=1 Tax=Mikania micrantha TaxID=192012 RepID=A0A5N6PAJ0_9ASTR|nr:hypothetical protein E3N88_13503 [Mikania micrantha]
MATEGLFGDGWVLDSGCSFHMTYMEESFCDLEKKKMGTVRLGDDRACEILGIGNVLLKLKNGTELMLKSVRYVPDLKRSLISMGTFEKEGMYVCFKDGKAKVIKGSLVMLTGTRRGNNIYVLDGEEASHRVLNVTKTNDSPAQLWHKRLGHISQTGLKELEKQGLLDYFGGASYFLSIMDDHSRRVWVYLLKGKNEAFDKFVEWKTLIEKQTERQVKKLRTDNGLEFCNREFNNYCKKVGIARHLTIPGTPQQNGLVERMNRTLLDRVRCMLDNSGLPKYFWGEAVTTAAYLINRSPSAALEKKTAMEVWSGKKSDYSHLRVFGSLAYAHVSQGKLEPRAQKCVFLGYPEGIKGYRLWRLENPKAIISRDVVFKEDVVYKDLIDQRNFDVGSGDEGDGVQIEVEETGNIEDSSDGTSSSQRTGTEYSLARDRPRRNVVPPLRYTAGDDISAVAFMAAEMEDIFEPLSYDDAISCQEREKWLNAMKDEMDSLWKNGTWVLVDPSAGKKLVKCKWLYKIKEAVENGQPRYKARLVAKAFAQQAGVDYTEIFSPVVKHTSIRLILSIVAAQDLELEQLDVKTAFLHGYLDEQIYMEQPKGFESPGNLNKVCLLKRSLYGIKQSPRQWYKRFDDYIVGQGFRRSEYDQCVYLKEYVTGSFLYLLLYMDDMLIVCKDKSEIEDTKSILMEEFEMKCLGEAKKIIGMEILRDRQNKQLKVCQMSYITKVLKNYGMENSKVVKTPLGLHFKLSNADSPTTADEISYMNKVPYANAVGSLMYLMVCSRPDIGFAVSLVSRYLSNPGKVHWDAVKWILRYLNGTRNVGLVYGSDCENSNQVYGFVDSDFAKDLDKGRSITGYAFKVLGNVVSWKARLQYVVALSTTEAEYIALTEAMKEALWLCKFAGDLGLELNVPMVNCDSQGAVQLAKNSVFMNDNPADMLTKSLSSGAFECCLNSLGIG